MAAELARKWAVKGLLRALEYIEYGSIELRLPSGESHAFAGAQSGPAVRLEIIDDQAVAAVAMRGDIGFAEAYRDGWIDVDDLSGLLNFALMNEAALVRFINGGAWSGMLLRAGSQLRYWLQINSRRGSRRNIHAHYDVGNSFFQLWLDSGMTYSSGIFDKETDDLQSAQYNKYDRILGRMNGTRANILEIGCGWGGFAERAVQQHDHKVTGITISQQQHEYAARRLAGQAQILLEDYRDQKGQYDHLVSIEMFEAVGEKYWPQFFDRLKSLLAPGGSICMQVITICETEYARYRRGADVIRSFIFPGGMLPSYSCIQEHAARAELRIDDAFRFADDYVKTLSYWQSSFEENIGPIRALGYDERFIRIWRLYLAYCEVAFKIRRTDVMQIEMRHA